MGTILPIILLRRDLVPNTIEVIQTTLGQKRARVLFTVTAFIVSNEYRQRFGP